MLVHRRDAEDAENAEKKMFSLRSPRALRLCVYLSTMKNNPPSLKVALTLICVLAAGCIAIPAYVFLWKAYAWHLKQPETVQGGIELLAVFAFFVIAVLKARPRIGNLIIAAIALLYLQLHSILLPAAAALLYFESLIQIGGAIQRLIGTGNRHDCTLPAYLGRFLIGAASWILGALILSASGAGTISALRIYALAVALVSIAVEHGIPPLCFVLARRFEQQSSRDRTLVAFLLVMLLIQFGKANYGFDYDSTWYGLRPERILTGPHSIFDDLKLVHYVYYYPKQFEMLTLPLAALNRGVFIIGFNVLLLGLGFIAVFETGRELHLSRTGALLISSIAASIPAWSNMASTAKTDNLLAVYAFIAVLFMWRWCKQRRTLDLAFALTGFIGMAGTKINAYAYAPLLAIGFLAAAFWRSRSEKGRVLQSNPDKTKWRMAPIFILAIAACTYGGLILRTWILTGIPTMPMFAGLWEAIGVHASYPWNRSLFSVGSVPPLEGFFAYWFHLLFDPRDYSHYLMVWPGNAAFFSVCAVLILFLSGAIRRGVQMWFLYACVPLMAGGIVTACAVVSMGEGGTDGNYYAIPVILTILAVAGVLASASGSIRNVMVACSIGFIVLHLPIMFVSHWSWHPGTQSFQFALNKTLFDTEAEAEARLKRIGAWNIEEYLRKNMRSGRCVGFSNGEESSLHMLSCIHEDFEQAIVRFPRIFETELEFRKYLAWANPDLLIMPKSTAWRPAGPTPATRAVFRELAQDPNVIKIESPNYTALDFTNTRK